MSAPAPEAPAPRPDPGAQGGDGGDGGGAEGLLARERERLARWFGQTAVPSVLAIVLALLAGAVLIAVSDQAVRESVGYFFARPSDTLLNAGRAVLDAYAALVRGSLVDTGAGTLGGALTPLADTLVFATPLVAAGLAVALPFRAGMINIGAEGQIIASAILAGYVGFALDLPPVVHVTAAVLAGLLGGALWGGIPGVLKATTGAHEVIVTIMLNAIAGFLVLYLLGLELFQRPGRNDPISPPMDDTAVLPRLLDVSRLNVGFLLALAAAVAVWWLLQRSTIGFRFRAVGANPEAARTAGMSVPGTYVAVMAVAGALAGVAGVAQVLGSERQLTAGISAGLGFDAITVALLGRANPAGVVAAGILFGGLRAGGLTMQAQTGTSLDIVVVVQALVVLFVAAPALIAQVFRLRSAGEGIGQLSKGWNA